MQAASTGYKQCGPTKNLGVGSVFKAFSVKRGIRVGGPSPEGMRSR